MKKIVFIGFILCKIPSVAFSQEACLGINCNQSTTQNYHDQLHTMPLMEGHLYSTLASNTIQSNASLGPDERECIQKCDAELIEQTNDCNAVFGKDMQDLNFNGDVYSLFIANKLCYESAGERHKRCLGAPLFDRCYE